MDRVEDSPTSEGTALVWLSSAFRQVLGLHEFEVVGTFSLDSFGNMVCSLNGKAALNATYSIYAFVGVNDGGRFLRIGKYQAQPVIKRILSYPIYINASRDQRLGPNGHWAGGTKPWERDGWFGYLREFGMGLIYVKAVAPVSAIPARISRLRSIERALINEYRPPLCNDAPGKSLQVAWEAKNGKSTKHFKTQRLPPFLNFN